MVSMLVSFGEPMLIGLDPAAFHSLFITCPLLYFCPYNTTLLTTRSLAETSIMHTSRYAESVPRGHDIPE